MGKKILLKRSSVSGRMPNAITGTSVEKGELFMNIATGTNVNNFLTTLKANGNSANTGDYIKWSDDKYNESKYQPKGNYLTSYTETYKGTVTGVTAGNGLTGGGTKSTGSTGYTLNVGEGTGITVSADSVSISTDYQNKIASGTSAYTMVNTLSGSLIDVEYVVANALNKINESAGFDENGNSTLPNGISLTEAINAKPDTDTLNTVGATEYNPNNTTMRFIGVVDGASASKQSYMLYGVYVKDGLLYTGGGRMSLGTGIQTNNNNTYDIGSSAYRFKQSYINIMHGVADSASTVPFSGLPTGTTSDTVAVGNHTHSYVPSSHVNSSGTSSAMGHVKLVDGELSGITTATRGEAAASYHKHSNYSLTGHTHNYAASSHKHVGSDITGGTISTAVTVTKATSATTAYSATTANNVKVSSVTSGTRYLVGVSATTASSYALNAYNSVWMNGGLLYASSDERLKDFTDDIKVDFETLKGIPKKYFYWKDKENRGTAKEIGTSAQKLMEIYPEIVTSDDKGNLGVSYERLSIIALAAIDKLYERIKILEEKLNDK